MALVLSLLPSTRDGNTWGYSPLWAQTASPEAESADRVTIERTGGQAGGQQSNVESRGEVSLSHLSAADRQAIEEMFRHPENIAKPPKGAADYRVYKMQRQTAVGSQTIDNVWEGAVPLAVQQAVTDRLK